METKIAKAAGHIEAIEEVLITLIRVLEKSGHIDDDKFIDYLNHHADALTPENDSAFVLEKLEAAKQSLYYIAEQIDIRHPR